MRFLVDAQLPARLDAALLGLFAKHLDAIVSAFGEVDFVELQPSALVLHGRPDPSRSTATTLSTTCRQNPRSCGR